MIQRKITKKLMSLFYLHLISEERSRHTIERYLHDVKCYALYLGEGVASAEGTRGYKERLCAQGYAAGSVNTILASLNAFFKFAGWTDCRTKRVRSQPSPFAPEDRSLTRAEYDALTAAARPRHRLIIETIGGTGIRVSELAYITVEAAREGRARVRCKNKTREILIPGQLRKKLLKFAGEQGIVSGPVFLGRDGGPIGRRSVWAMMKRTARRAGVAPGKVFPHNLRKLFARSYYGRTRDVAALAAILGHGSMETTRIYLKAPCEEQRCIIEGLGLAGRPEPPGPPRRKKRKKGKKI